MKALQALLVAMALAGCTSVPVTEVPRQLFADAAFAPPATPPTVADVFAMTDEMRQFADREVRRAIARNGTHFGMFQALQYDLHLDYDAANTRTAEQAYTARAGNCLSLVILTAAFAKYLEVPVYYQHVIGENAWSRASGIAFMSGHVNLKIGYRDGAQTLGRPYDGVTIDFLAPGAAARFSTRVIPEDTLLAMYLNNRAAEALVEARIDDAYWWSRAAIEQSPAYQSATNTLGVIYLRHGNRREAERAFRHVLEREPANANAMTNLVSLLKRDGRMAEAADWRRKLVALEPYPPFYFLDQGLAALDRGDPDAALALFERELDRLPYNDELHFAIATADLRRGQLREAARHLAMAEKYSTTRDRRDIYGAKLAHLRAITPE
jgi:Tfp pilus assembly protein PilF